MTPTGSTAFLDALLAGRADARPGGAAAGAGWLERLRASALERANALSVPTPRDEEWRFTDLAPLTRLSFQPVHERPPFDAAAVRRQVLPEAHARLVFIDGVWMADWSRLPAGCGISVLEPGAAMSRHGAALEQHLGQLAAFDTNVFAALNTAFMRQAAVIVLAADAALPGPVHLLHLATRRERAQAIYPRTLLVAGRHSRCTLIEDFAAADDEAAYFSAPVTEISLDSHAAVTHVRLQREAEQAFQLGTCAVMQASGSSYQAINIALGARLSRLELNVVHGGTGCSTTLDGLAMIDRRQLADTHSFVDHAHAGGHLRQKHKCVVAGGAHAVFNGKILVREGAQQTDAGQSLRALLLSERAHIDAKPQLEIFADDVKCAHGAAIGQLDPEELFYLRSRGLSQERAHNLLTYAFAAEVIERIAIPTLTSQLARAVLERTEEAA